MTTTKRSRILMVVAMAVLLCALFAVSAMASTEIKGGFGEILGLDSTKTYQISSRTLSSDGKSLDEGTWTDYDPTDTTVSLAGIYGVREKDTQEFLCNVYVYGAQSDRANLFTTTATSASNNGFIKGKWTGNYAYYDTSKKYIRASTAWRAKSYATALTTANAMPETTDDERIAKAEAILTAKNNILNGLNTKSFKYGYDSTDIIAFDEVNTLTVTLGAHQYAYTYNATASAQTSGTNSVSTANIVIYVTDLDGNVTQHTYTTSSAKISTARTINFETAKFTPSVPVGRYIVGIQFFPFSGWTEPDKLNMWVNGTTYGSSGAESGYVKWAASTYYSIDTVTALPPSISVTSDGKITGLEDDKSYQITSMVINSTGTGLKESEWVAYDENATLAGLYKVREVDAEGNALSKGSNMVYVYGDYEDRAKLFKSDTATDSTQFTPGSWTGYLAYADTSKSYAYIRSSGTWIATSYYDALETANAMSETTDEEIATKAEAILKAKNNIFGVLNGRSLKYAYDNTDIIPVDEINSLTYQATTGNVRYYAYDKAESGNVSSQCTTDVVLYVTDIKGNVTKHTTTLPRGRMDQDRTLNFETATFTPEIPKNSYAIAIEFFPYSGWTDPDLLSLTSGGKTQQGAIIWTSSSYYSIEEPILPAPAVEGTLDGKISGLEDGKLYEITSLTINNAGTALQQSAWTAYDATASLAGLYQVRQVDDAGNVISKVSDIIYVYGTQDDREDLFTTNASTEYTSKFYAGLWTSSKRAQYNLGVICTVLPALDVTYADALKAAMDMDTTTDEDILAKEEAILAAKNNILNGLQTQSFRYGYDTTDIIAFDEVNELSVVLGAHQYAYTYNATLGNTSGAASKCEADIVIYVTDLDGNVSQHTYTTTSAKMSATRTINFKTGTFTPEVPEGSYVVGIQFFPFAHWTDPDLLDMYVYDSGSYCTSGNEMGKVDWTASSYYSIDIIEIPVTKTESEVPEISFEDTYGILTIDNYNEEYDYAYSTDGGETWTAMTDSYMYVNEASTEYVVKVVENDLYLESEASEPALSPAVVLVGASLILDGKIGIKAYFDIDTKRISELDFEITKTNSDYENDPTNPLYQEVCNAYIGSTSTWNTGVVYDEEKDLHYLIAFVPAKDIDNVSFACDIGAYENDAPTVRVFYHDMYERFGFNEYIEDVKTFADMGYEEFEAALDLVNAMEVYCAGADVFFDDNKTFTEEISLTEDEINALEEIKATLKLSNIITNKTIGNLEYYASTLILGESVTIRHYFKVNGEVTASDYTVTGATPLTVENESLVYVDVVDVPAQRLSENIQVTVTYGDESTTITYSALHYVSGYYATSNDELRNLAKAIYRYSAEADMYNHVLNRKKIIFIGDSFVYYGNVVINGTASRYDDKGYFYQLCKANGLDVSVTNWTYGSTGLNTIYNNYIPDLEDYDYDYVVLSGGRNSSNKASDYITYIQNYMNLFKGANPDVKFLYLVSSGAHNISVAESFPVDILNNLDEFEKMGVTIVDWGKLVADVINGVTAVPGGELEYDKNSFIVHRTEADGYHPNPLSGYITALMTYCAITGESAVDQPYDFWNDSTVSNRFNPNSYIPSYYVLGDTNYDDVFKSPADMKGIQTLIDRCLEDKAYLDYNFEASEDTGDTETTKDVSILFIGNSYTYYNNMPTTIFKGFATQAGYNVTVKAITNGGHTLEKHANPDDTYGAQVEAALTGETKYDYVVIQEQSERPISNPAKFYAAVRNLAERIREHGATPILYSTWGRKTGAPTMPEGETNESMTWKIAAAYQAIGNELNIAVAHSGLAFYDVYTGDSGIEIYHTDYHHPSYAGSYLSAATLFTKIFDADPTLVNYVGELTSKDAIILRQAAKKAVFETPAIPEEYKTTSENT